MYQIKVDKSNKSAVFGKKIGAEYSAPKNMLVNYLVLNPNCKSHP